MGGKSCSVKDVKDVQFFQNSVKRWHVNHGETIRFWLAIRITLSYGWVRITLEEDEI